MAKKPVRRQASVTPAITAEMTEQMATYRHDDLATYNRELKAENFNSEEEYRAALLNQYEDLRYQEYNYTVRNETLKAYNLSCDGRKAGINPNNAWGGYHEYPQFLRQHTEHADSAQVQQFPELCTNPKYMNTHKNIKKDGTVKSVGAYTCAITSTALQMQICDKMGYDNNSIIINKKSYASAVGAATCVPEQYQINGDGKKTLNQMILSGEIGVGDEVSIYPKPNNKKKDNTVVTASGKHCITIAAVNRNKSGEIIGFTYQANNVEAFRDVDIHDNNGQGGKLVYNAVKTHVWMEDKIKEERTKLSQKTTEELAAEVSATRQRTGDLIDNLQKTEQYAASHRKGNMQNYLADAESSFRQEFNDRKSSYEIRRIEPTVIRQADPAVNIPTLEDIKIPEINDKINGIASFKDQRFDAKTEEREKVNEATRENKQLTSQQQKTTTQQKQVQTQNQEEPMAPTALRRQKKVDPVAMAVWQQKQTRNG